MPYDNQDYATIHELAKNRVPYTVFLDDGSTRIVYAKDQASAERNAKAQFAKYGNITVLPTAY